MSIKQQTMIPASPAGVVTRRRRLLGLLMDGLRAGAPGHAR